ncbi:MAG: hypothetical protein FWD44_08720 [Oscillospiraceae bacterium]|nr:hypothetical protein [Oscillospiraceae bacterium]
MHTPISGFTLDPKSGLFYEIKVAPHPDTGQPGQFITWFYPATGEYKQTFTPDAPQPASMPQFQQVPQQTTTPAQPMQPLQQAQQFYQPQPIQQYPSEKKGISPFTILMPVVGLIVGVLIAIAQHTIFN